MLLSLWYYVTIGTRNSIHSLHFMSVVGKSTCSGLKTRLYISYHGWNAVRYIKQRVYFMKDDRIYFDTKYMTVLQIEQILQYFEYWKFAHFFLTSNRSISAWHSSFMDEFLVQQRGLLILDECYVGGFWSQPTMFLYNPIQLGRHSFRKLWQSNLMLILIDTSSIKLVPDLLLYS